MFVYMERNVRIHNRIPFYLRWLITIDRKKKQLRHVSPIKELIFFSFRGLSRRKKMAHGFENEASQTQSTNVCLP